MFQQNFIKITLKHIGKDSDLLYRIQYVMQEVMVVGQFEE